MVAGFSKTTMAARFRRSTVAVLAAAALLGGCATGDTGANEPWDPLETPNRFIFSINRAVDIIAIRPVAVLYRDWMPAPAQRGVHNLLDNLGEPVTAINEVVQGDPSRAATTMARFLVNSTIGLAGIFDVATSFGLRAPRKAQATRSATTPASSPRTVASTWYCRSPAPPTPATPPA